MSGQVSVSSGLDGTGASAPSAVAGRSYIRPCWPPVLRKRSGRPVRFVPFWSAMDRTGCPEPEIKRSS